MMRLKECYMQTEEQLASMVTDVKEEGSDTRWEAQIIKLFALATSPRQWEKQPAPAFDPGRSNL
jgi:hypothetical protein